MNTGRAIPRRGAGLGRLDRPSSQAGPRHCTGSPRLLRSCSPKHVGLEGGLQAWRVLLRAKKKKGGLLELQTQIIQETGRDPEAEVHGPFYEQWAVALSKP